jgi:IS30 family transposase
MAGQKLALQWSPQQISGWLKQEFPTHQDMQISHEAIYRSLFIRTRGVRKKELRAQLRTARRMRRPKSQDDLGHATAINRELRELVASAAASSKSKSRRSTLSPAITRTPKIRSTS